MMKPLFVLVAAALVACGSKPAPPPARPAAPAAPVAPAADTKAAALAAETAAYEKARPVFEKYCADCHRSGGDEATNKKLAHFDMDTYPFGGEHAPFIGDHIRQVLGLSGEKATMPYDHPGSVTGEDLALVKAWADAWEAAERAGAHPPHGADPDKD